VALHHSYEWPSTEANNNNICSEFEEPLQFMTSRPKIERAAKEGLIRVGLNIIYINRNSRRLELTYSLSTPQCNHTMSAYLANQGVEKIESNLLRG